MLLAQSARCMSLRSAPTRRATPSAAQRAAPPAPLLVARAALPLSVAAASRAVGPINVIIPRTPARSASNQPPQGGWNIFGKGGKPPSQGGGGGGGGPPQPWVSPDAVPVGETLESLTRDLTDAAHKGLLDPVIGREEEIRRTLQVLSRRTKNNPVLLGDAGVGKTAIAEGIAQRIALGEVPESVKNKRVLALDLAALVSGTKYRGDFEERIQLLLKDLLAVKDSVILFIDEIHMLMKAGSSEGGQMDAANILKPALARGDLHCVGATTTREYRQTIEKDPALARRFQPITVSEPTLEDSIAILRGLKEKYEAHHRVRITDAALVAAAVNSQRYVTDRFLPDKAIDLIDEAASRLRLQQESKPEVLENLDRALVVLKIEREALRKETDPASLERMQKIEEDIKSKSEKANELSEVWRTERAKLIEMQQLKSEVERLEEEAGRAQRFGDFARASEILHGRIPNLKEKLKVMDREREEAAESHHTAPLLQDRVTPADVLSVISRQSGIPLANLMMSEKKKLLEMESLLTSRVVGQPEAVTAVSNAVRISRAGLHQHNRPLGSFLFVGPTGVGKTELCRALAEFLFDTPEAIVRLDMSEYQESHNVSRMIGAPPGYVGYEEGGTLTEAVRRRPFSVILFDEIEKAHRSVSTILLQIMDAGHLTDGQGRKVDFRNTIIILTSNLGAPHLVHLPPGASAESARPAVMASVQEHFLPEFLNRLDQVVLFRRLSRDLMTNIVDIQLAQVFSMLEPRHISLHVTAEARDWLGEKGFDPFGGARSLRRTIQTHLLNPLSMLLLEGQVLEGAHVSCDIAVDGTALTLKTDSSAVPEGAKPVLTGDVIIAPHEDD